VTENPKDRWLESSRRLIDALDEKVRSLGRGAITEMELALGRKKTRGWWQNRVKTGYVTTAQLFGIFEVLGLDPGQFIREVLGKKGGLELHRPKGPPPEIVRRAWARFRDNGDLVETVGESNLRTLDTMRYENPQLAVDQALATVAYSPRELLPRLLGITGSAWRLMAQLDKAEPAIYAGIQMAQELDDQQALGELLQRLAYVYFERSEVRRALLLGERATITFLRCENRVGVGKTLVDQGIWLRLSGMREAAIASHGMALDWLPPDERHNRAAAHQHIALNCLELGFPGLALECLPKAESEAVGLPRGEVDKLNWLRALILVDLGQLDESAHRLEEVVAVFAQIHLGDMALAVCDLVQVEIHRGDPLRAANLAKHLLLLVEPLRDNQIASNAIADLLRDGPMGLTLALVQEARTLIEGELRKRCVWQRLWVDAAWS
jgi:tetratricopeptide (TPR) repeat protein